MFDTALHTGVGHPDLTLIILTGILSFAAGLGLGSFSDRLRNIVTREGTSTTD